jgi:hypothetical protein
MLLYVDAAASFWREWVINYDVTHQQTLGEGAGQSTRRLYDDLRHWFARNYYSLLNSARKTHQQITHSPGRWIGGGLAVTLFLTILVNLRSIVRALGNRRLRAHPDRAPRESASLWYDQMLRRLARRGWRKTPAQTPHDFVAAIQEPILQSKVALFTRAYESARFGQSADDARALPELFEEIMAGQK